MGLHRLASLELVEVEVLVVDQAHKVQQDLIQPWQAAADLTAVVLAVLLVLPMPGKLRGKPQQAL